MKRHIGQLINRVLPSRGIARQASILAGGTAGAQVLAAAIMPVLTRLYTASDFGYLQVFTAAVAICIIVVAWRFDFALPLPQDDEEAVNLLALALAVVALMSSLIAAGLYAAKTLGLLAGQAAKIAAYWWLVPISVFAGGIYIVLSYWAVRFKRYPQMARSKLAQIGMQLGAQLGGGLLHFGAPALMAGDAAGRVAGSFTFIRTLWQQQYALLTKVSWSGMRQAARRYRKFPLISTPGSLINSLGLAIPVFLLATFYGSTVTGWFSLVDRVVGSPAVLVGFSLQQVYLSEGANLAHHDPRRLRALFLRLVKKLAPVPLLISVGFIFAGPQIFRVVFGRQWEQAGHLAQVQVFAQALIFLFAPVSMTLYMLEKQSWQFAWDLGRLIIVTSAMIGVHELGFGPFAMVGAYAASMAITLLAHVALSYYAISQRIRESEVSQAAVLGSLAVVEASPAAPSNDRADPECHPRDGSPYHIETEVCIPREESVY